MSQLNEKKGTKGDALDLSLEYVRDTAAKEVPGHEREWSESVEEALGLLETALRQHRVAAKSPDGPLGEVDETWPTLARKADKVRIDLDKTLAELLSLRKELKRIADSFQPGTGAPKLAAKTEVPDFTALRQQVNELVERLKKDKEAEARLVLDSIDTDIGGEG
jgi:hypothetical protein